MHSQNVEARKGGTISRSYLADSIFAFRAIVIKVFHRFSRRWIREIFFFDMYISFSTVVLLNIKRLHISQALKGKI